MTRGRRSRFCLTRFCWPVDGVAAAPERDSVSVGRCCVSGFGGPVGFLAGFDVDIDARLRPAWWPSFLHSFITHHVVRRR